MRECTDLKELYYYFKQDQKLDTYAGRRYHIKDAFRPLLDPDVDSTEREAFFVKGADHDAYVHIRSITHNMPHDLSLYRLKQNDMARRRQQTTCRN